MTKRILLMLVTLTTVSFAQQMLPNAPVKQDHKFLNKGNVTRLSVLAVGASADGFTTQTYLGQNGNRELNPLARPLVTRGIGGQVAASVIGVSAITGAAYLFHKHGHHTVEHWLLNVGAAGECGIALSNYVGSK